MPHVKRVLRVLIALVAAVLLLLPGFLTAIAWSPINLGIAMLAVVICIAVARWTPSKWRWPASIIASLLIAVPPYPNWLWVSEERGWHFHIGARLETLDVAPFAVLFVIALALFAILFWAVGRSKGRVKG